MIDYYIQNFAQYEQGLMWWSSASNMYPRLKVTIGKVVAIHHRIAYRYQSMDKPYQGYRSLARHQAMKL